MSRKRLGIVVLTTLLIMSGQAVAHEYWFEREGNDFLLYQGHLYSSHKDDERVPYDPAIVKRALCVTPASTTERPRSTSYPVRFAGPCTGLLVQASSGYWSQTLTGTKNKPKGEVAGVLRSWQSEESIKYIDGWMPALAAPLAQGFELVPLSDPQTVAVGDKLKLVAAWQGKPKAGVAVAYQGETRGVTGPDGTVNIRVRERGTQVIAASFEEPLSDGRADKIVRATILQFQKR